MWIDQQATLLLSTADIPEGRGAGENTAEVSLHARQAAAHHQAQLVELAKTAPGAGIPGGGPAGKQIQEAARQGKLTEFCKDLSQCLTASLKDVLAEYRGTI